MTNNRRWIEQIPSLISTLGVLGTFLGITVGLIAFDSSDLDKSIPSLLDGLKTAFLTSLAGMIGSIILSRQVSKVYDDSDKGISDISTVAQMIVQSVEKNEAKINSMVEILGEQNTNLKALHTTVRSALQTFTTQQQTINSYLYSLLECIKNQNVAIDKQTNTINDIYSDAIKNCSKIITYLNRQISDTKQMILNITEGLTKRFDEFSELLKKSNTEALVEVMKSVTEEFQGQMNNLINKLVQENFDQLNKSVEQLNLWQQENKTMISALIMQYKQMCDDLEMTSTAIANITANTKLLVGDDGKLQELITALKTVMIDDKHFIEITSNLSSTASLTKTNMKQFEESTKALNNWVRKQRNFVDSVVVLIEKLEDLNKIRDYNDNFWKSTKHSLEEGIGYITQGTKSLNQQLTNLDRQFYSRLSATLAELDNCIQAMIKSKK